jgi:DNA-binding PadR family transcriptional regulator
MEEAVLLILREKASYGLEIQTKVQKAGKNRVRLEVGSLYPLIYRLVKKGLIKYTVEEKGYKVEEKGGEINRKFLEITPNGVSALEEVKEFRRLLQAKNGSAS